MNVKINEYVHENIWFNLFTGSSGITKCLFKYEPLEKMGAVNLAVEVVHAVYGDICRFCLLEPNSAMTGFHQYRNRNKAIPESAIMNSEGVIKIVWDKYPGEHYLRVSYDFPEDGEFVPDKNEPPHNWLKDGF